jgi:hypothetical protein
MSSPQVYTATFAFVAFFTTPDSRRQRGALRHDMPCTGNHTALTLGLLAKDHTTNHLALVQTPSEHLDYPDRVDVEVLRVLRHDGERSLSDEGSEELLRPGLLGGKGGGHGGGKLLDGGKG